MAYGDNRLSDVFGRPSTPIPPIPHSARKYHFTRKHPSMPRFLLPKGAERESCPAFQPTMLNITYPYS
jgi:hypothetical protein